MAAQKRSLKLLFDENIGAPMALCAINLLRHDKEIELDAVCQRDYEGSGADDPNIAKRAGKEGRLVITGDCGRQRKGPPLDLLIPFHGASGVFFTGALHSQRPQIEKIRAVISLWPKIKTAAFGDLGLRYKVRIEGDGFGLHRWPLTDEQKKRQVELLGAFPESLFHLPKYDVPAP